MPDHLTGQRLWVTRPDNQSARLLQLLTEAGARPVALPLLGIAVPLDTTPLDTALEKLAQFDLAIFVSPSALEMTLAALHQPWPAQLPVAVIGPGSQRLAATLGLNNIICPPTQFDSEGLLALPELQDMRNKKVLILRGNGGRDTLPTGLAARGAEVQLVSAYRRLPPAFGAARLADELGQGCDGIIISSSEAAQHLFQLAGAQLGQQLQSQLFFAPHPRIAETLRELGVRRIEACATGDDGILAAIRKHFCNN